MTTIFNGTFETNTQNHVPWFSATVTRSTADFHSGVASLSVVSTAAFGSAVQLDNYPYFTGVTPGATYDFKLWHKYSAGATGVVTWNIEWRQSDATAISTIPLTFTPGTAWTEYATTLVAPALAANISWNVQFNVGTAGPTLWLDDILIADVPGVPVGSGSTPPTKVWTGSAWVAAEWKAWNGTGWTPL